MDLTYRVLLHISHLYHWEALEPVYHLLRQDPRFQVEVYLEDEPRRRFWFWKQSLKPRALELLKQDGVTPVDRPGRYDFVLASDVLRAPERFGSAQLGIVNHGTGIKTVFYRLLRKQQARYHLFLEGHYRKQRLQAHGLARRHDLHITGYPKLDPLFQNRYRREEVLGTLGLDPTVPTVLYAPSYKPSALDILGDAVFRATRGYQLIVKLHPFSWTGWYAPHRHHKQVERWVRRYHHAVLLPWDAYRVIPYVVAADVVISEVSSTLFEFLAAGKFGVVVDLPAERLKHSDGEPLLDMENARLFEGAFPHVQGPDDLHDALEAALHPTRGQRQALEKHRRHFFYGLDGKAAHRVVAIIKQQVAHA